MFFEIPSPWILVASPCGMKLPLSSSYPGKTVVALGLSQASQIPERELQCLSLWSLSQIELVMVIGWKSHTYLLKACDYKIACLIGCFYLQTFIGVLLVRMCLGLCDKHNWLLLVRSPIEVFLHSLAVCILFSLKVDEGCLSYFLK